MWSLGCEVPGYPEINWGCLLTVVGVRSGGTDYLAEAGGSDEQAQLHDQIVKISKASRVTGVPRL